jgi:hypothetical protein
MKNSYTALFVITALVLGAILGYYFGYDHGWENSVSQTVNPAPPPPPGGNSQAPTGNTNEDAFHKDNAGNYYGTLTLTGYLDVQKRVCNPGDMCGETVDYASFIFTQTSSEAIKEFTGQNQGNSFIAGDRVGLGCQQKNLSRIYYQNFADEDNVEGEIEGEDYTKLIASTKDKPVQIKLTRELYTSGRGAPDCYSHFRNFDVL